MTSYLLIGVSAEEFIEDKDVTVGTQVKINNTLIRDEEGEPILEDTEDRIALIFSGVAYFYATDLSDKIKELTIEGEKGENCLELYTEFDNSEELYSQDTIGLILDEFEEGSEVGSYRLNDLVKLFNLAKELLAKIGIKAEPELRIYTD
jgi:hypothetical protein